MGLSAVSGYGISLSYSFTVLHIHLHYYIKVSHSYKEGFIFLIEMLHSHPEINILT